MKNFSSISDIEDINVWIDEAERLKANPYIFKHLGNNKTIGLFFFNSSLRTRLSTQKAALNLGMNTMVMNVSGDAWGIEFEDGTPSSAPQMANDVSEYLYYVAAAKVPDIKILLCMVLAVAGTFYSVSYMFTKQHFINLYSHRFEVYAVKNGGYKKFREKMFKTHKTPGNWLGAYS